MKIFYDFSFGVECVNLITQLAFIYFMYVKLKLKISRIKILDSIIMIALILVILFMITALSLALIFILNVKTSFSDDMKFLSASIFSLLMEIGIVILTYKISRLKDEKDEARKETEIFRIIEHTSQNNMRVIAYKEKNKEIKDYITSKIIYNQTKKTQRLNPIDTGIKTVDMYLRHMYDRSINENIMFCLNIKQSLTSFVRRGILSEEIHEIVINLVDNAFKYAFWGEEGAKIESRVITLSIINYSIIVSDTGLQFPDDILQKLGGMGTTTHGTGVGWPTIINILNEHGGTYDIKPTDGQKYGKSVRASFESFHAVAI